VLATPAGASLLIVTDHGTMSVEAVYPSGVPGAEAWAKRAESLAAEIWETLAVRRTVRAR
jgi:hypothetical protein